MAKHVWYSQTVRLKEEIFASSKDNKWIQDTKGYFLIRVNAVKKRIEAGFVTNKHVVTKAIYGKNAQDMYHVICSKKMISRMEHAAYLGKELYKAELALTQGKKYVQGSDLVLN